MSWLTRAYCCVIFPSPNIVAQQCSPRPALHPPTLQRTPDNGIYRELARAPSLCTLAKRARSRCTPPPETAFTSFKHCASIFTPSRSVPTSFYSTHSLLQILTFFPVFYHIHRKLFSLSSPARMSALTARDPVDRLGVRLSFFSFEKNLVSSCLLKKLCQQTLSLLMPVLQSSFLLIAFLKRTE